MTPERRQRVIVERMVEEVIRQAKLLRQVALNNRYLTEGQQRQLVGPADDVIRSLERFDPDQIDRRRAVS